MRISLLPLALLAAALATLAPAQTTGVPGLNDYTINGVVSGSQTNCIPLCNPAPTTLALSVSTVPTNFVMVIITTCPCRNCAFPWLPNLCVPALPPAPFPPCNGGTNQSLDILLTAPGCAIVWNNFLVPNTAGIAGMVVPVPSFSMPPCSVTFSTQAVVFDLCGTGGTPPGPGPFVLTQAYTLAF